MDGRLVGDWAVTGLDGDEIGGDRLPTLQLHADGQVTGFAGVNRFFGSFVLDGDVLSFSALASTLMAGPDDAMRREQQYLQALQAGGRVRVHDDVLTLTREDGAVVLRRTAEEEQL